jgi:serine protease Do
MRGSLLMQCFKFVLLITCSVSITASAYEIPKGQKPSLNENDVAILEKVSRTVAEIAKHAKQGIVFVSVSKVVKGNPYGEINPFDFFFGPGNPFGNGGPGGVPQGRQPRGRQIPEQKQKGVGSGFFIDLDKGYILTNNHVIDEADDIQVKLANGQNYAAKVVGRDKFTDVAVVKINDEKFNRKNVVALSIVGDSAKVQEGDFCIAVGAPFGLEASVSLGVVSAVGRGNLQITDLGDFIQTDAAINPGNSGGPLLNVDGEVIGMNTAIFSKSGAYNGIGFSIPGNLIRTVATQLIGGGKVERGYLGVGLADFEPDMTQELGIPSAATGALVRSMEPGSPAAKGGLEPGDVIFQVDNSTVRDSQELRNVIGLSKPGKKVTLKFYRDGKVKEKDVTLGNYANAPVASDDASGQLGQDDSSTFSFGMKLASMNPKYKTQYGLKSSGGALVVAVIENSPADRGGLQPGDLIVKVNKDAVKSPGEFNRFTKNKERVLLRVERRGDFMMIPLRQN